MPMIRRLIDRLRVRSRTARIQRELADLDYAYEMEAAGIAAGMDRMSEIAARKDALTMQLNEIETGERQVPRSKDHWNEVVMNDLPF